MLLRRHLLAVLLAALPLGGTLLPSEASGSTAFGQRHFEFAVSEHPVWARVLTGLEDDLRSLRACRDGGACAGDAVQRWAALLDEAEASGEPPPVAVNALVNRLIRQKSDSAVHGGADVWATPLETLRRQEGDCEDIAILKLATLIELGAQAKDLRVLVLKVRGGSNRGAIHAVLLAGPAERGRLVLDSLTNRILPEQEVTDYLPLYSVPVPPSLQR